jgi:hypothetical protein
VLLVLEMLWGRATLVVFAVSFDGMPDFKGSLMALLDPDNIGFIVAWARRGRVVRRPDLLGQRGGDADDPGPAGGRHHRRPDQPAPGADQPGVMLWWGALITVLVVLALLPWFAGPAGHRPGDRARHLARLPRGGEALSAP